MSFLFLSLLMGIVAFAAPIARAEIQTVVVPVADVWSEPAVDSTTLTDDKRETQALYGERVIVHESSGAWLRIEALEQPTFRQHKWEGYPGWVAASAISNALETHPIQPNAIVSGVPWWQNSFDELLMSLPIGSKAAFDFQRKGMKHELLSKWPPVQAGTRTNIIHGALLCLGSPYLWGGLTLSSPPYPEKIPQAAKFGLDCSGLIHLVYRINGIQVPRDAHEQWMKAKPIILAEMKPGDLIFSAKADNPMKITHVALYAGDGQIIEAPQTGMKVQKISFKKKYGLDLSDAESGETVGDRVIYFGSFMDDVKKL